MFPVSLQYFSVKEGPDPPDLCDNIPVPWHRQKNEGEQNKEQFIGLLAIVYRNRDLSEHGQESPPPSCQALELGLKPLTCFN